MTRLHWPPSCSLLILKRSVLDLQILEVDRIDCFANSVCGGTGAVPCAAT